SVRRRRRREPLAALRGVVEDTRPAAPGRRPPCDLGGSPVGGSLGIRRGGAAVHRGRFRSRADPLPAAAGGPWPYLVAPDARARSTRSRGANRDRLPLRRTSPTHRTARGYQG